MQIRACRDCGEEYRLDAQVEECVDCGGPIETHEEGEAQGQPPPPAAQVAAPYRRLYGADRASDIEPMAKALGGAGVPFAVRNGRHTFELWIPAPETARAREVLAEWLGPPPTESDENFDLESGHARCPACDTELAKGAAECPECGLAVGAMEPTHCLDCEASLEPGQDRCPSCGARL